MAIKSVRRSWLVIRLFSVLPLFTIVGLAMLAALGRQPADLRRYSLTTTNMNTPSTCVNTPRPDSLVRRERFERIFSHTVALLNSKLTTQQISRLAAAMPSARWEFPEIGWHADLCLTTSPERVQRVDNLSEPPALQIVCDSAIVEQSAAGKTSFGAAFLAGQLRIAGLPPLQLTRFMPFLKHFLTSYCEAAERVTDAIE